MTNGTAQLFMARIQNEKLSGFIAEKLAEACGAGELLQTALEVLSCIAFKQPVKQAEIDRIIGDINKRHVVAALRKMELVEEFAGPDGRLRFATTGKFVGAVWTGLFRRLAKPRKMTMPTFPLFKINPKLTHQSHLQVRPERNGLHINNIGSVGSSHGADSSNAPSIF